VEALARLESAVESLCDRRASGPVTLPRGSARELTTLAERLDGLHARLEGTAPVPAQTIAAPTGVPESTPAPATILGEPAEFDLALLMQQLVEPARGLAHSRGIEVQLVYPDGLPSQILGHPMVLFRAVDSLLRSALRTTRKGNVTLRVSRASVNGDARLRFEVADTSPGIPFKEQEELGAALAAAAAADPSTQTDPLRLASALAAALGGELGFVSQPGQGSRFGFAIALQESANPPPAAATPPLARTGFRAAQARTPLSAPNSPPNVASKGLGVSTHSHFPPSASTAFLPAPSSALPPRSGPPLGPPISSFQPRPNLPLRRSV
jgi:signal transduction histidine kinase